MEVKVEGGKPYTPPMDGVFMSDAQWNRYQKHMADYEQFLLQRQKK